ncbi:hypothetical protein ACO1GV_01670 [Fusobacterium watanabei]|uniref:hypothetical protein n=1 Tax=Fusobacterium watanabei TaxID=2686067 RepID=UPI003B589F34
MLDKVIINLFGIDLYFMDLLTIAVILLFAPLVLVKLDKNSEDKEVKKKIVLRNFLFILCITGIFLSAADRKMRNEHKINVNQIIVLDEKAVNDDRSFIYLVTEEFKLGVDVVVLMPQNYNKEKLYNLAELYNYKILTEDTMEVRYDKEVKGIENDRIIFRKK